jgi:hypothetical protein
VAANWLGIDRSILKAPPTRRVNRSLTAGESYVITWLNRSGLHLREHLGKALVEKLPNIESENFYLPSHVQDQFVELIKEDMTYVSQYVSDGQEYQFDRLPDSNNDLAHCFTSDQLDLILSYLVDNVSKKKKFRL